MDGTKSDFTPLTTANDSLELTQAKHAAPKHADPADYAHATGLEALWGYLYVTNQTQRLDELITLAIARTEEIWHRQNSK